MLVIRALDRRWDCPLKTADNFYAQARCSVHVAFATLRRNYSVASLLQKTQYKINIFPPKVVPGPDCLRESPKGHVRAIWGRALGSYNLLVHKTVCLFLALGYGYLTGIGELLFHCSPVTVIPQLGRMCLAVCATRRHESANKICTVNRTPNVFTP